MTLHVDLLGQRFGRLVVQAREANDRFGKSRWHCRCDCGKEITTRANTLKKGETQSCGCLHAETVKVNRRTHGAARTPLYRVWSVAKGRCHNPKDAKYRWYGARGIVMCARWLTSFADFRADMGPRPSGGTLKRRDNNGPYAPENCYWATRFQQGRNRRDNVTIVWQGKAQTLGAWAEESGLPESMLYYRIRIAGWPVEKALTTRSRGKYWSPKRHLTTSHSQ